MSKSKITKFRHISAASVQEIEQALALLGFKVEIKGNPVKAGKRWYLFFTIDDHVNWESVDL